MENENFEKEGIRKVNIRKVNARNQIVSKAAKEILRNIIDCGEDYVNWDNYKNLGDEDARYFINNGYGIQVLRHIAKFKPTKNLFIMLYETQGLGTIALALQQDLTYFSNIGLNAYDADSWIDNGDGELIQLFNYLFSGLNVNTAERLATKGLLHQYDEDNVISTFGVDKEKVAELMKRSQEQEKIIKKLENDAIEDEDFRNVEEERQNRDS